MSSVVIPARNEADRIGATVAAAAAISEVDEVIVVDDGSADDTARLAAGAGATVLSLRTSCGKAAAVAAGVSAASSDIVLLLDADLAETASEGALLLAPVAAGEADMTIATFPVHPGRGGGLGLVVRASRYAILRATGRRMVAPLSGQRAMRRAVWQRVGRFAPGFGLETGLTIDALRAGFTVLEVPTQMDHRVTGRSLPATLHRLRQLVAVLRAAGGVRRSVDL